MCIKFLCRILEDLVYLKQWITDLKKKSTLEVHHYMILDLVKVRLQLKIFVTVQYYMSYTSFPIVDLSSSSLKY